MTTASVATGSRFLWVFSSLLSLSGAVLIVLGLLGTSDRGGGDLIGVSSGDTLSISDDGMSIWSPSAQSRAETVCSLGEDTMLRPVQEHATTVEDTDYFEVARTPDGMSAGTYVITCDTSAEVYAGPYGPTVASPGLMGATGLVVGILLLALGLLSMGLAWAAGGRRPDDVGSGPDPGDYTLARHAPLGGGPRPGMPPPPATTQPGPGASPGGPGSTPNGPRYDLPPPS